MNFNHVAKTALVSLLASAVLVACGGGGGSSSSSSSTTPTTEVPEPVTAASKNIKPGWTQTDTNFHPILLEDGELYVMNNLLDVKELFRFNDDKTMNYMDNPGESQHYINGGQHKDNIAIAVFNAVSVSIDNGNTLTESVYLDPETQKETNMFARYDCEDTTVDALCNEQYNYNEAAITASNIIVIAARTAGVVSSLDLGTSWYKTGIEMGFIVKLVLDPQNQTTLYALNSQRKLFRSIDQGLTWQAFSMPNIDVAQQKWVSVTVTPEGIVALLNSKGLIYETAGEGAAWTLVADSVETTSYMTLSEMWFGYSVVSDFGFTQWGDVYIANTPTTIFDIDTSNANVEKVTQGTKDTYLEAVTGSDLKNKVITFFATKGHYFARFNDYQILNR